MCFLSLGGVTFRLGDRLLFENTSWTWHRHEQWGVVGPNGSGKSLFGDGLRGRLPVVNGELRYYFRSPAGLTVEEAIGHVSFEERKNEVHQTVVQSRWNSLEEDAALKVRDFLTYERVMEVNPFEVIPAHRAERRQFERRRNRAVTLLRVAPFLDRTLLSLSNGERQRVQLARALCHPLRLLILDEPFIGLDAATLRHFRKALEHLMRTSLRIMVLTTRPEDLPRLFTHAMVLNDCRISAAGASTQVLAALKAQSPGLSARTSARSFLGQQSRDPRSHTSCPPRTIIQLRNVTVRYGDATILRNIDWSVRAGESWALLGPNGAGKTTLLSLILGDNPQAYANEVQIFGRRRGSGESIWELKQRIGWVSAELQLHFDDSVSCFEAVVSGFRDSIGVFERPTRHEGAAARMWLARFGLMEVARTPLFELSVGLQRMVLLARALVKKPELLILDEPCQGLDAPHRELFLRTVDELISSEAVTAIYVTHRAEEIPPSIKRVLKLSAGRANEERTR